MKKGLRKAVDEAFKKHVAEEKQADKVADAPKTTDAGQTEADAVAKPPQIPKGFRKVIVIQNPMKGSKKVWYKNPVLWILVIVAIGAILFQQYRTTAPTEISLDEAYTYIADDQVKEVKVDSSRAVLQLGDESMVYAVIPSKERFSEELDQKGISAEKVSYVEDRGSWVDIVSTLVYVAMLGGIIFFAISFSRQMGKAGGGLLGMGESRAKVWLGKKQTTGFKDVAGSEEAVDEVKEIVEFLKNAQKFRKVGARIPKGVLIVGPPGTGKTLIARAIAGEAAVPFFFTSGSEFEEMLVGAGASRVRDLFEKAKKVSPAIIFIDEIDAVGRKRGTVLHTGTSEQTLNQILVEMDGFDKNTNVIVMGATNRPDVLDPALLRPGRFDRIIALDLPDIAARKAILIVHSGDKPLGEDVDLERIARRTVGFSGADLENVLNEAAILTARRDKDTITMDEFEEAISKVQLGPAKKRMQSDKVKKMIAYHEAGHALVSHLLPDADEVLRVSIVSRGLSLGATEHLPKEEHEHIRAKSKIESDITVLVAGHVSEKIAFGEVSTGAENDIREATKLSRAMVSRFGMSELGPIQFSESDDVNSYLGYDYQKKPFSEKTAAAVDDQVFKIVDAAYQRAETILRENKDKLDKVVEALVEKETLDSTEFKAILEEK